MKRLELNQMESIQGSFDWKGCATGSMGLGWSYMTSGAALFGGWIGLAGAAVAGCEVGGIARGR